LTVSVQEYITQQARYNNRRRILRPMLQTIINMFSKIEVRGLEHIPDSGSTMLMGNHISYMDPPVLTAKVENRYLISMAKAEALDNVFNGSMLRLWGNFVVNRGEVDRKALTNAIELLNNDYLLWIAAEGTRNPDGMEEAKSGIVYIANKANALVIPTAICGIHTWASQLARFTRVRGIITFGRPFRFRVPKGKRLSREIREQMTREAMYQVALAMPDEYADHRGVYWDIEKATTEYLEFV
jgi:1-acyl-sn-glycerol-3-phosphate acyltransferase